MEIKTMAAFGVLALLGLAAFAWAIPGRNGANGMMNGLDAPNQWEGRMMEVQSTAWPGDAQDGAAFWENMRQMHNAMHGTDYAGPEFAQLHAGGMASMHNQMFDTGY